MDSPSKVCTKCGEKKELEAFDRRKDGVLGRGSHCKACRKVEKQGYRAENLDRIRAYERGWQRANLDRGVAYSRKYRAANPDKIKAANDRYDPAKRRAITRRWEIANPDKVLEKNQRRRARIKGAYVAPVHFDEILQRDLGHCGICGGPIMGPVEIDHVVPLAAGGTHEPDNVQCAHASCNRRKSARLGYQAA